MNKIIATVITDEGPEMEKLVEAVSLFLTFGDFEVGFTFTAGGCVAYALKGEKPRSLYLKDFLSNLSPMCCQ